jgi:hypothetical protein
MTVNDYIDASESDADLRRALAADPEKLAAALEIVARAKRLDPDASVASEAEKAKGDD